MQKFFVAAPLTIFFSLASLGSGEEIQLLGAPVPGSANAASAHGGTPDFTKMNEITGVSIWGDASLWDDTDTDVAKRLKLPPESKTDTLSSFRDYRASTPVFGARPRSFALYGSGGKVEQISIVYANKGDSVESTNNAGDAGAAQQHIRQIRDFKQAVQDDTKQIDAVLRSTLGEPINSVYGQGSKTREMIRRWNWAGHAILLTAPRDEYVSIRIVPSTLADAFGRGDRVSRSDLLQELKSRVERRPNGDVVVTQIPMINQGGKGFCAPATWERYLRFMGIPADMYLLAMAGDTSAGGGTYTSSMVEGAKMLVLQNGRRIESPVINIDASGISRFIDNGQPIMWGCFSTEEETIFHRNIQRLQVTDWNAWKRTVLEPAKREAPRWTISRNTAHLRMIIGYNRQTGEVAISDSWGKKAAERWMLFEEANKISQRDFQVIVP